MGDAIKRERTVEKMAKSRIARKVVGGLLFGLVLTVLTGCNSDGITDETMKAVQNKKNQVLALYSDVEKMIQDNSITVDESFTKMKEQLVTMSKKVDEKIKDTTEEDAKRAMKELDRLEENLQAAKKNVESHIAK